MSRRHPAPSERSLQREHEICSSRAPRHTYSQIGHETVGNTVTLTLGCVSACTVTINVTEAVTASASTAGSTASRARKTRTKTVTLGASRFAIPANRSKKPTVKLTRTGKRLLAAHHDRLNAHVVVSEKGKDGIVRTTSSIKITPTKPHKK
jgi:hypothetical protein